MSMPRGYDAWKTASPYDEFDDERCIVCDMELAEDPEDDTPDWDGFCSLPCQAGYEHWQELCAATEPGVTISPKLWHPDCVRPMFDYLCQTLATGSGDGIEDNVSRWSTRIYRGTTCGAWLKLLNNNTLQIGSIVEGADQCTNTQAITWPFTNDEFWAIVQTVQDEADAIWNKTHGCHECGLEDPETGLRAINTGCGNCRGQGTII